MKKKNEAEVIQKIEKICQDKKYVFHGFCDINGNDCVYENSKTHLHLFCQNCGNEWHSAQVSNFLKGMGCPKCGAILRGLKQRMKLKEFIQKAKLVHGNKYDLSKVDLKNKNTHDVNTIICHELDENGIEHGEFHPTLHNFLLGSGCPKCAKNAKKTYDEFLTIAHKIHGDNYIYNNDYVNQKTKIKILCQKCGNYFWQTPADHVNGHGCPKCKQSKLEKEIKKFFNINKIKFEEQKTFQWLGRQSLDFYLPQYNIGIECQGKQHFFVNEHFGGEKYFNEQQERDERKRKLCEENGVKLLYYSNLGIDYPYHVFENKEELLKSILT